jgi:hypothetical protein
MRLLYVNTFTSSPASEQDSPSSDSIGYGVTSSAAVVAEQLAMRVLACRHMEAMYTNNVCLLPVCGSYPEICRNDSDVLYGIYEEDPTARIAHLIVHRGLRE